MSQITLHKNFMGLKPGDLVVQVIGGQGPMQPQEFKVKYSIPWNVTDEWLIEHEVAEDLYNGPCRLYREVDHAT